MADFSARYGLPFVQSGQAQKEVIHNAAIAPLDALLCLVVESRTLLVPPAVSSTGGAWIVGPGASGAWSGQSGKIAILDASGWSYVVPPGGALAFIRAEGVIAFRLSGVWQGDAWPAKGLSVGGRTMLAATPIAHTPPAGGTVIDAEARAGLAAVVNALRAVGLIAA